MKRLISVLLSLVLVLTSGLSASALTINPPLNPIIPPIIIVNWPAAPSNLTAVADASGFVHLTWVDNSNNEESFTIQRKTGSGIYNDLLTDLKSVSLKDYTIEYSTTYTYRICAVNFSGSSAWSNEVTVTTYENPLKAPSGLTLGTYITGYINISWTDNSSVEDSFTLQRKTAGGSFADVLTGITATEVIDYYTTYDTTYTYRVKAINALGDSPWSDEATLATFTSPTVNPPTQLVAAATNNIATISWKDNATNEVGYTVERKEIGGTFAFLNGTAPDMTSLVDNSLVAGKSYVYRVKAINVNLGDSAYSNEATVAASPIVIPVITPAAITTPAITGTVDFSSASTWAVPEIQKAMGYKLTTDKVLVGFTQKITREEFCEIAVKLYLAISGKSVTPTSPNPFMDTANPEILKAYKLGIVKGISETSFVPGNPITRQEICVMLLRTLKASEPGGDYSIAGAPFIADEKQIALWALESVKYMNKADIMKGTGGSNISPLGNTTKEQAIALITRMYEDFN